MTCAIHQPNLFPRSSTLRKIAKADVWIVLDDVQFNRRDYQHRARLAHLADETQQQRVSLSLRRPSGRASLINEVVILDQETNARRVTKTRRAVLPADTPLGARPRRDARGGDRRPHHQPLAPPAAWHKSPNCPPGPAGPPRLARQHDS